MIKKGAGLILVLCLILFSNIIFVSSQDNCHPICNPTDPETGECDPDIHGAYIPEITSNPCVYCGEDDGYCPEDFGAVCDEVDPDCAGGDDDDEIAFWSSDGTNPDTDVNVVLDETTIYMIIKNVEELSNGDEVTIFVKEKKWFGDVITEKNEEVENGDIKSEWLVTSEEFEASDTDEFYFKAEAELSSWEIDSKDYDNGVVTINETLFIDQEESLCSNYETQTTCEDDNNSVGGGEYRREDPEGSDCYFISNTFCGWDDSTGKCVQKRTAETSDPENSKDCTDKSINTECSYPNEEKIGDCSAGEQFFMVKYTSNQEDCLPWETQPIPCPSQIKVDFFNAYGLILSILLIAGIYFILIKKEYL